MCPEKDKYFFDLNGYLVIRNVYSAAEVAEMNSVLDARSSDMKEREAIELKNADDGTPLAGSCGRKDMGGILEWGERESFHFRSVLDHPSLRPYYHEFMGAGYRMDHLPFIIAQDKDAEGFKLHGGTVDCSSGSYNPEIAYSCVNGRIFNRLLAVSVVLTDHNEGDGGFVIVRGSHKSNFACPPDMINGIGDGSKYKYKIFKTFALFK